MVLNRGKKIRANESADLATGGSNGIVLSSNGGGTCLGGDKTDVVTWSSFTKGEEDAVDNDEASDVCIGIKQTIAASHDETNDALEENTNCEGVSRPNGVTEEGSANSTG